MMAQNLGDIEASRYILRIIKDKFRHYYGYKLALNDCAMMQEGMEDYMAGRNAGALEKLEKVAYELTTRANLALLNLRNWKCRELVKKGRYRDALAQLETTFKYQPVYVDGLYNAGVLGYQVELVRKQKNKGAGSESAVEKRIGLRKGSALWKRNLRLFLKLAPNHRHAGVARLLLEGKRRLPAMCRLFCRRGKRQGQRDRGIKVLG